MPPKDALHKNTVSLSEPNETEKRDFAKNSL